MTLTSPSHTNCWSAPLSVNVPVAVLPAITLACIRNPCIPSVAVPDSITTEKQDHSVYALMHGYCVSFKQYTCKHSHLLLDN